MMRVEKTNKLKKKKAMTKSADNGATSEQFGFVLSSNALIVLHVPLKMESVSDCVESKSPT